MSGKKSMTLLILLVLTSSLAVDSSTLLMNLTSDVNTLKSRITTLESESRTIASDVTTINNAVEGVDANVAKIIGGFRNAYLFVIGTVGLLFTLNIIIVYSLLKVRLIQESKPHIPDKKVVKTKTKEVNENVEKKRGLLDKLFGRFKKKQPIKKEIKKKKKRKEVKKK